MSQRIAKYFLISLIATALFGCESKDGYFDRYAKLDRSEFAKALVQEKKDPNKKDKKGTSSKKASAPIPQISNMLSFPKPPAFTQGSQIISFSVTQDIDLKDVLIELGRVTGLDIDIDPAISGGVIINARNRTLDEVIKRIANLGGLRYSFDNDVLTFKKDTPYTKHYQVDYLIDGALWGEVETNISSILSNTIAEGEASSSSIASNKSAGIITIFSNNSGQDAVTDYLAEVKEAASAQVLIEAKVVEVTLKDEYNAGIDWSFLDGGTSIANSVIPATDVSPFKLSAAGSGVLGGNVTINLAALEKFGSVRAISSPRISALNNRKATLDFVNKLVYFTLETESNTTNSTVSTTTNTITATLNEESIGVELEITPSINVKYNEITLAVHPKLSIQSDTADDPSVDSSGNSLGNKVPIIQTREINTTVKIKSGDTLVIGGLMTEDTSNDEIGIPFLQRIPFLGNLFKYTSKTTKIVETVIFIKATIVDSASGVNRYDRDFHNKFSTQKRPYL